MDEDDYRPQHHWGDLGAIFIAAACSLFALGMIADLLLGGHPLAGLTQWQGKPAVQSPAVLPEPDAAAPMHLAPGEVRIVIHPQPKNPPPKP